MGAPEFIVLVLLCFHSSEETDDLRYASLSKHSTEDAQLLRDLEDITDMLEETATESRQATDNESNEEAQWQNGGSEWKTMSRRISTDEGVDLTADGEEAQAMLTDLEALDDALQQDQHQVRYKTVGCYKDDQVDPRPLPELLTDLSGEVDWYDLDKVIRKCAQLANEKDYTYFGMQSFGQCRSGKTAASSYNQDGDSSGCQSGLGGRGENLVFEIISPPLTTPLPVIEPTTMPSAVTTSLKTNEQQRLLPTTIPSETVTTTPVKITVATSKQETTKTEPASETTTNPSVPSTIPSTPPVPSTIPSAPPECLNYKLLTKANRAEGYSTKYRRALCDKKLSKGWYRFTGEAGNQMPDFCVAKLRCGAHAPGWLNSSHPSVADGVINNTQVCFHWGSNCCYWSTEIRVRNCGRFFVYELHPTPYCSLRYCGNKRLVPVLTTLHTSITSAPTTLALPIECSAYRVLSDGERSQNYQYRSVNGAKPTCDRWLPSDWYRFTGLAGDRMPYNSVPAYRCGTLAPGWLRGAHPSVRDGAVPRTICFNWGRNNCRWRRRILVRNCGDFYVYKLQNVPVCKLRYCGVGIDTAGTTSQPSTPPVPTESNYGFVILCLPTEMQIHIRRKSLPAFVNPNLLRLDDPRCRVELVNTSDVTLTAPLNRCGTIRRTEDDQVTFQNKVVAEIGAGNKRSFAEFPFRCIYKRISSLDMMKEFQPLYKRGQVIDSTSDSKGQAKQIYS